MLEHWKGHELLCQDVQMHRGGRINPVLEWGKIQNSSTAGVGSSFVTDCHVLKLLLLIGILTTHFYFHLYTN